MSRASWYRYGKPDKKPMRLTRAQVQAIVAARTGISVRSLQRAGRIEREAPDLVAQIKAGTLKLGTAERIVIERANTAAIAWLRSC